MSVAPALALELSQRDASVALRTRDGSIVMRPLGAGRDAAESALAVADEMLRDAGLRPRELRVVAASVGPGGFTGVRIAVASAQAIAEISGAAAVAVPSAAVIVESTLPDDTADSALSILAIRRRGHEADAWVTTFTRTGAEWSADEPGRLVPIASIDLTRSSAVIAERLLLPELTTSARWVEPRIDAAACLVVAERMLAGGVESDPLALRAIYPRRPEAVAIWNARHGA